MTPQHKADRVMLDIAREPTTGNVNTIRTGSTERVWLAKLAETYGLTISDVWRLLLHQAIIDEIMDGEVLALSAVHSDNDETHAHDTENAHGEDLEESAAA